MVCKQRYCVCELKCIGERDVIIDEKKKGNSEVNTIVDALTPL